MIFLTFFIGIVANFIGYIPPGNINLTLFFFTYFIMHAAKWLSGQVKLDTVIDWVMVVLFGVLGAITWVQRKKTPDTNYSDQESIKYGILLGFLNPMQIPFWMITASVRPLVPL
eukprot:gene7218-7287_t